MSCQLMTWHHGQCSAAYAVYAEEADADDGYSDAPLAKRSKPTARKPVAKGANQAAKPQKRKRAGSASPTVCICL